MSSFVPEVTKYLDFAPSRAATKDEAKNSLVPFDKYYELHPSRAIKKIPYTITLKAHTENNPKNTGLGRARLMFQYNLSAPADFYLFNANSHDIYDKMLLAMVTIKYRVGTTVFRKAISWPSGVYPSIWKFPLITDYNNEIIKKNCVFEVWVLGNSTGGLTGDITINTALLVNPQTADELNINLIESTPKIFLPDLANNIPLILPTIQTNLAWLDN